MKWLWGDFDGILSFVYVIVGCFRGYFEVMLRSCWGLFSKYLANVFKLFWDDVEVIYMLLR